ncbi:epididymal-specific lipocalin-5-like isoform X4 [Phacochoerus africanus]|uniref:epididymal-specific lipocalin-5-like isoform X4 n=2 Tax=Phacochoerus africanus TaxID=41426 RepID=UPI001FD8E937|nr:epididymal-specific lipocalin-5-like isoform X4 [Phacochoerus africanus]
MRGKALAGLLGLLVVLVASAEEMGLRDFNATQFSGLWYEIALASNLEPQTAPQLKKMGAVLVEREGPYLTLTSVSDHINRCVKETTQAVKGDAPGKFKFPKEPGNKDVTVVATDYRTYAIVNVAFQKGRTAHRVLKLYSRDMQHNERAMAHFLLEASERGLSTASVQLLLKDCECPGCGVRPPEPVSPGHCSLLSAVTCVNLLRS